MSLNGRKHRPVPVSAGCPHLALLETWGIKTAAGQPIDMVIIAPSISNQYLSAPACPESGSMICVTRLIQKIPKNPYAWDVAGAFSRRPAAWWGGRCLRGLSVLVYEVSRRVWGLRLRRTEQGLALSPPFMLPSAHFKDVGVRIASFRNCCRRARVSRSRLRCDRKQRVSRPNHNPT
jgi:hypothetical protein